MKAKNLKIDRDVQIKAVKKEMALIKRRNQNRLLTLKKVDRITCRLIGENCKVTIQPVVLTTETTLSPSVEKQLATIDAKKALKIKQIKADYYKKEKLIKTGMYSPV